VIIEARNHWLFRGALATKPNYSSGGLGKAGGRKTTGLYFGPYFQRLRREFNAGLRPAP
jgi:hypothetical protein